jgi:hypothetical protein
MSAVTRYLKRAVCARTACWESETFVDGGVTVVLGSGWECFMSDRHFSNAHGCVARRTGGFCDGIAAFSQASNREARVVEAKATPDFAAAKPQLRKGLELVAGSCGRAVSAISLELHTHPAGEMTARPSSSTRWLQVGRSRLPIRWIVDGVEQF